MGKYVSAATHVALQNSSRNSTGRDVVVIVAVDVADTVHIKGLQPLRNNSGYVKSNKVPKCLYISETSARL